MAPKTKDTPENYPMLGRWISWVDKPSASGKIFWLLVLICAACFALDWTYQKKSYFDIESWKGFYAYFAFVMFAAVMFITACLRVVLKVRENFYGEKSTDAEDYPEDQIQRIDHNA